MIEHSCGVAHRSQRRRLQANCHADGDTLDHMLNTRQLGSQGLAVSSLGLGLMGMSHAYGTPDQRDEAESIATIKRAIDLGVTFFDTAEAYGPFRNEELFARALEQIGVSR